MRLHDFIEQRVANLYWREDQNCAITTLTVLSEIFEIELHQQVLDSALGMHGAGKYGAQCGIVEGFLMLIGIYGRKLGFSDKYIVQSCYTCAAKFEAKFGSLTCKMLRPEGFPEESEPQHFCELLTRHGIEFAVTFIKSLKK